MAEGERAAAAMALEGLARAGERVLDQIQALEVAKARLEADLLAAYGALATIEAQQIDALPAGAAARVSARVLPERVVTEEIALATGVGVGEVARRLSLATAPRRHRVALDALRSGAMSLHRALQVASDTAALPDTDVTTVAQAVLAPTRDGQPVAQRTFTARLRRAVASVDARGAAQRRAHARSRRGVFARLTGDGTGCLTVTTDAATITAVMDRLDTTARRLRGAGDPRSLDQLRADLATTALLRGAPGTASGTASGHGAGDDSGQAAALAWIVVPFEVATGQTDTACELPGHGWVTAGHAREIITRPGSLWATLPVDIRTGRAISRPTRSYRPTPAMVEHVQAVDGICRGPGCHVPATRCDLDHETPWPTGPTSIDNLHAKHRLHHNLKTDGTWTCAPSPDDGLTWTTLTGRTYTTHPKNWRDGIDPPGPPPRPRTSMTPPDDARDVLRPRRASGETLLVELDPPPF
ncbi:HNH endonuclease signature motif containing protein [Terracoccus sp. 273MFTsu3.1]|uniref:HNH endonuclease signature motif containing protein n=1 Tax=Terracoccus sp. 273MFTsu3.1 TaxID=1172188 RepID=UPI001E4AE675|nr:HNH endonuclease signature motif containing protein [Terracoccus sp. 273MFTsu3.1]